MRTAVWLLIHLVLVLIGFIAGNSNFLSSLVGRELAVGASASLIAAGITGFSVVFHNLYADKREILKNRIYDMGLRNIFNGRSVVIKSEYSTRIVSASTIDVMGFGLSAFRQDYGDKFASLSASKKIRVLLLHPSYPDSNFSFANQRDVEEHNSTGSIAGDIVQFIRSSQDARDLHPHNFEIRLMTCLPSINLFRFDGEMLWGPYLVGDQSRNMPTFLLVKGDFLFDRLAEHFEIIWNDPILSTPVQG